MNSGQHFGNLLRAWRTDNQWTQQQVADAVGWDKPQVSRLELGRRGSLAVEEALMLCSLMGMDLQDAVRPIPVPKPIRLAPDWLGRRVAEETGRPYSEVYRRSMELYGRNASTEHAHRCSRISERGAKSFAISRGNITRGITSEIASHAASAN